MEDDIADFFLHPLIMIHRGCLFIPVTVAGCVALARK
jgi:hypothetical protein